MNASMAGSPSSTVRAVWRCTSQREAEKAAIARGLGIKAHERAIDLPLSREALSALAGKAGGAT
jgi:hypothetical protein